MCLFGSYFEDGQDVAGGPWKEEAGTGWRVCLDEADVLGFPDCQLWDNNVVLMNMKVEVYTVE